MKTLIIHVGDHKTGSSSIQHTLNHPSNSRVLNRYNTTYCLTARGNKGAHHKLVDQILEPKNFVGTNDLWASLAKEIQTNPHNNFIISTEGFEKVTPHALKQITNRYMPDVNIKIMLYLRPHISRIVSSYSQITKQGLTQRTLEEHIRNNLTKDTFIYAKRVRILRENFKEGVIIRPFIRSELHNKNVIDDFLFYALNIKDKNFQAQQEFKIVETNVTPHTKLSK